MVGNRTVVHTMIIKFVLLRKYRTSIATRNPKRVYLRVRIINNCNNIVMYIYRYYDGMTYPEGVYPSGTPSDIIFITVIDFCKIHVH